MARSSLRTAIAVALGLSSAPSPAVTVELLFKSGDAASDGTRLDSLEGPVATSPSALVFRGRTSAILVKTGTTFTLIARTGDPLGPPHTGTFFVDFHRPGRKILHPDSEFLRMYAPRLWRATGAET